MDQIGFNIHLFLLVKKNEAHQEVLKREIERLRHVYHQQNLKKMENPGASPAPAPPADAKPSIEKEQVLDV